MPNKRKRNKKTRSHPGVGGVRPIVKPRSLAELITQRLPGLVSEAREQSIFLAYVRGKLTPELAERLCGAQQQEAQLVLFTESAVWAARLRYALPEVADHIRNDFPAIRQTVVRVMPRAGSSSTRR
jgi:hypothetical protein